MISLLLFVCTLSLVIYCLLQKKYTSYSEKFLSQLTNTYVNSEITDIQTFVRQFGYPLVCKKGVKYGTDEKNEQRCEKVNIHSDWTTAKPNIRKCFSILVPLLEEMGCNRKQSIS